MTSAASLKHCHVFIDIFPFHFKLFIFFIILFTLFLLNVDYFVAEYYGGRSSRSERPEGPTSANWSDHTKQLLLPWSFILQSL